MYKISCPDIKVLVQANNLLGEGPLWDSEDKLLYWVDTLSNRLFVYNTLSNQTHFMSTPLFPSAVALCADRRLLLAVQGAVGYFDRYRLSFDLIALMEHKSLDLRSNDGKVDPLGSFWLGSKSLYDQIEVGNLASFGIDRNSEEKIQKLTIANGMCWDIERSQFYFIDSFTRMLWAYDYAIDDGGITNPRACIQFSEEEGYPDGMTIDRDGILWIAMWDGWGIYKYDPVEGRRIQFFKLPVSKPTSCIFGGDNLDTLFVTSARDGLSVEELDNQPNAGAVFAISNLQAKGLDSYKFNNSSVNVTSYPPAII